MKGSAVTVKCPKCQTENPGTKQFCGDCGTPLPFSKDIRPNVTETMQTPIKELTSGSTFAGRYQVIEELGHGGMGRVYKVLDTDIKEKIALKVLRPEIALDKETVERFSNELKLARKISQRNVCRMFDLGRSEGTTFITMEFVPGEDLKSFIHRAKQLSTGTAISIAKQVCEGLEEAHRLGVIHRDLKPGNIMIDKDGDAKIMDFGIARSLSGRGITGAGVLIGTPEYMSPEQVEGKDIDQRSDLYSLGVILYEMVTGRLPFAGETPLSVAHKHKYEAPEDPKKLNAQLPDELARVILKCLEKDADKRYQSAAELGAELGRIEEGLPTTARLVAERKHATSREITLKFTPKKLIVPGLVLLALMAIGITLLRVIPPKKSSLAPSVSGKPILAILYFENKSGDAGLDNWREALPELLITALSQSKYIRVVTNDEMYTILKRLGLADARKYSSEDIEKIASQTRATHVLRGSFMKAGESYIITAGLQKPDASEKSTPLQLEASGEKDIIVKVNELTRQIKEGLDLTAAQLANDIEKEAGKITTSSPEALKYYIEGRRYQLKTENDEAIAYLKKAVEIDPEFAMAYRALRVLCGDTAEGRNFSKKAMELRANLPDNERLLIEAGSFVRAENYAKAIEVFETLVKAYPDNMIGHNNLGGIYLIVGEVDKAIEHKELNQKILRTALSTQTLANVYMAKGLYQQAEDVCRSYLHDVEDNAYVREYLLDSYLMRRQFDLALKETDRLSVLDPSYKSQIGDVLLLKGDFTGAEKVYRQVYEKDHAGGRGCLHNLADIRGKFKEALDMAQQGLEESKGNKERESRAYRELSGRLEKAGRYEEAYKAAVQSLQASAEFRKSLGESAPSYLPSQQKNELFWKGRILAEMKSFDEARRTAEELKSVIDKGINAKELRYYEYIFGLIEFGKRNYGRAAEFFASACAREGQVNFEGNALFFNALARALFESGDLGKARQEYEKITLQTGGRLAYGDVYAKAFYMLGKIAERQGDKARARENYEKFLDLWKDADPGQAEVEDARKRLAALK